MPAPAESRVYRHEACGGVTVVDGDDFEGLSDPLTHFTGTWCTRCNDFFPVDEYEWLDTGERLTDYYARHTARATSLERFLASRTFSLIVIAVGFIAGTVGGFFLTEGQGFFPRVMLTVTNGVISVIILGSLNEFVLSKLIHWRVCGVSDTRMLK